MLATSEKVYNLILDPGVLWEYHDEDAGEGLCGTNSSVRWWSVLRWIGSELNTIMQEKKDSHYVMLKKQLTKDRRCRILKISRMRRMIRE